MELSVDYGTSGLSVQLPDENVRHVLRHSPAEPLVDPSRSVREELIAARLPELARGKQSACLVVCDITRPVPNALILAELLDLLGLPDERITILIATGTHRASTPDERLELLGPDVVARGITIVDHDCDDPTTNRHLGISPHGIDVQLDTRWLDADLRLTVGLIEPHFMAGWSGGRKLVMPGIAGRATIQAWHSPAFLEDERARNGVLDGNPVHAENTAIAAMAPPDLICDVTLDERRRITGVFCGDWTDDWRRGTEFVARQVRPVIPEPVDVCVTSGGGHPLDATFYQVVKGIVGAYPIVRPGGTVVIAARMAEGIGSDHFRRTLTDHPDLPALVERMAEPGWTPLPDQWQVEMLARATRRVRVVVVTEPDRAEELRRCHVEAVTSLDEALSGLTPETSVAVIPQGPYVIPALASEASA